ncbi:MULTISPECIES: nucleotidyl transferase AbiEii/AbiGii toxin family protein [Nonomuraea]|uniref:Nucleotidyl transferase AbiEii/AbiGii toxin family protein n=1 Tax=Nonomuraea mangrovi TaxID=2316207 RepID=A0ABW4T2Y2_9ACTN
MRLPAFHARLLEATLDAREGHGLLLAGGHAMNAHGLTDRPSDDLVLVTGHGAPVSAVAEDLAAELRRHGFSLTAFDVSERVARMVVRDEVSGERCAVSLLKEALRDRPLTLEPYRLVGQDDAVALKVRALHGRGLPRDFIDVAAAAERYSFRELERLGAAYEEDWLLDDLIQRLESVDLLADEAFTAYGVDEERLHEIRRFAYAWAEEIKLRRADDGDAEHDVPDVPEVD